MSSKSEDVSTTPWWQTSGAAIAISLFTLIRGERGTSDPQFGATVTPEVTARAAEELRERDQRDAQRLMRDKIEALERELRRLEDLLRASHGS